MEECSGEKAFALSEAGNRFLLEALNSVTRPPTVDCGDSTPASTPRSVGENPQRQISGGKARRVEEASYSAEVALEGEASLDSSPKLATPVFGLRVHGLDASFASFAPSETQTGLPAQVDAGKKDVSFDESDIKACLAQLQVALRAKEAALASERERASRLASELVEIQISQIRSQKTSDPAVARSVEESELQRLREALVLSEGQRRALADAFDSFKRQSRLATAFQKEQLLKAFAQAAAAEAVADRRGSEVASVERRCLALEAKVQALSEAESSLRESAAAVHSALEKQRKLTEASDEQRRVSLQQTKELEYKLQEECGETRRLRRQNEELKDALEDARRRAAAVAVGELSLGAATEGIEALLQVERAAFEDKLLAKEQDHKRLEQALQKAQEDLIQAQHAASKQTIDSTTRRDEAVQTPEQSPSASQEPSLLARLGLLEKEVREERRLRLLAESDCQKLLEALQQIELRDAVSALAKDASASAEAEVGEAERATALQKELRRMKAETQEVKRQYGHVLAINEELSQRVLQLLKLLPGSEAESPSASLQQSLRLVQDALTQQSFLGDSRENRFSGSSRTSLPRGGLRGSVSKPPLRRHSAEARRARPSSFGVSNKRRCLSQDSASEGDEETQRLKSASSDATLEFSLRELQHLVRRVKCKTHDFSKKKLDRSLREESQRQESKLRLALREQRREYAEKNAVLKRAVSALRGEVASFREETAERVAALGEALSLAGSRVEAFHLKSALKLTQRRDAEVQTKKTLPREKLLLQRGVQTERGAAWLVDGSHREASVQTAPAALEAYVEATLAARRRCLLSRAVQTEEKEKKVEFLLSASASVSTQTPKVRTRKVRVQCDKHSIEGGCTLQVREAFVQTEAQPTTPTPTETPSTSTRTSLSTQQSPALLLTEFPKRQRRANRLRSLKKKKSRLRLRGIQLPRDAQAGVCKEGIRSAVLFSPTRGSLRKERGKLRWKQCDEDCHGAETVELTNDGGPECDSDADTSSSSGVEAYLRSRFTKGKKELRGAETETSLKFNPRRSPVSLQKDDLEEVVDMLKMADGVIRDPAPPAPLSIQRRLLKTSSQCLRDFGHASDFGSTDRGEWSCPCLRAMAATRGDDSPGSRCCFKKKAFQNASSQTSVSGLGMESDASRGSRVASTAFSDAVLREVREEQTRLVCTSCGGFFLCRHALKTSETSSARDCFQALTNLAEEKEKPLGMLPWPRACFCPLASHVTFIRVSGAVASKTALTTATSLSADSAVRADGDGESRSSSQNHKEERRSLQKKQIEALLTARRIRREAVETAQVGLRFVRDLKASLLTTREVLKRELNAAVLLKLKGEGGLSCLLFSDPGKSSVGRQTLLFSLKENSLAGFLLWAVAQTVSALTNLPSVQNSPLGCWRRSEPRPQPMEVSVSPAQRTAFQESALWLLEADKRSLQESLETSEATVRVLREEKASLLSELARVRTSCEGRLKESETQRFALQEALSRESAKHASDVSDLKNLRLHLESERRVLQATRIALDERESFLERRDADVAERESQCLEEKSRLEGLQKQLAQRSALLDERHAQLATEAEQLRRQRFELSSAREQAQAFRNADRTRRLEEELEKTHEKWEALLRKVSVLEEDKAKLRAEAREAESRLLSLERTLREEAASRKEALLVQWSYVEDACGSLRCLLEAKAQQLATRFAGLKSVQGLVPPPLDHSELWSLQSLSAGLAALEKAVEEGGREARNFAKDESTEKHAGLQLVWNDMRSALRSEKDALCAVRDQLRDKLRELKDTEQRLERQTRETQAEASALKVKAGSLDARRRELDRDLQKTQLARADVERQRLSLQRQEDKQRELRSALEAKAKDLEDKAKDLEDKAKDLEDREEELQSSVETLQLQTQRLDAQSASVEKERERLRREAEAQATERRRLSREALDLKRRAMALERGNSQLVDKCSLLQSEREALNRQWEELKMEQEKQTLERDALDRDRHFFEMKTARTECAKEGTSKAESRQPRLFKEDNSTRVAQALAVVQLVLKGYLRFFRGKLCVSKLTVSSFERSSHNVVTLRPSEDSGEQAVLCCMQEEVPHFERSRSVSSELSLRHSLDFASSRSSVLPLRLSLEQLVSSINFASDDSLGTSSIPQPITDALTVEDLEALEKIVHLQHSLVMLAAAATRHWLRKPLASTRLVSRVFDEWKNQVAVLKTNSRLLSGRDAVGAANEQLRPSSKQLRPSSKQLRPSSSERQTVHRIPCWATSQGGQIATPPTAAGEDFCDYTSRSSYDAEDLWRHAEELQPEEARTRRPTNDDALRPAVSASEHSNDSLFQESEARRTETRMSLSDLDPFSSSRSSGENSFVASVSRS